MTTLLLRIKSSDNPKLSDDEVVTECMQRLMEKYPQVTGYQFERLEGDYINVLLWGDLEE